MRSSSQARRVAPSIWNLTYPFFSAEQIRPEIRFLLKGQVRLHIYGFRPIGVAECEVDWVEFEEKTWMPIRQKTKSDPKDISIPFLV